MNKESSFTDEVVVVFVDSLRWFGKHGIDGKTQPDEQSERYVIDGD